MMVYVDPTYQSHVAILPLPSEFQAVLERE